MNFRVLGSTKVGYNLPIREAKIFAGKEAGICYMPDTIESLFAEDPEKSLKRAEKTELSGHHSVFGHPTYNFALEEIPKIIAMLLNNEKDYNTSEKSARYTKMKASPEELAVYEKWIGLYKSRILEEYPDMQDKQAEKLAMENARYLISVFTPATSMGHTLDFRQLNYILHWMEDYLKNSDISSFSTLLNPYLQEFTQMFSEYKEDLLCDGKGRSLSLFGKRERKEEWGENYCYTYYGTFAQLAQAMRHRTLKYEVFIPEYEDALFYIPPIIRGTPFENEWLIDLKYLAPRYPQGMLLEINERGTVEDFILKCKERCCGCAQLEIALQTNETMQKYLKNTKASNPQVYKDLLPYSKGARCTFPDYTCAAPCIWGAKNAFTRKI